MPFGLEMTATWSVRAGVRSFDRLPVPDVMEEVPTYTTSTWMAYLDRLGACFGSFQACQSPTRLTHVPIEGRGPTYKDRYKYHVIKVLYASPDATELMQH